MRNGLAASSKKVGTPSAAGIPAPPCFIDVFAGCGGISLGLLNAGWKGLFAVEKHPDAFATLKANLVSGPRYFAWPHWLPVEPLSTGELLENYGVEMRKLRGEVTLLAGGPPCQGFSLAGRRVHSDPRNRLTDDYMRIVRQIAPRMILIENVQGFDLPFKNSGPEGDTEPHSAVVRRCLEAAGYSVFARLLDLSLFGVPQRRRRYIILAFRRNDPVLAVLGDRNPFDLLVEKASGYRRSKGLRGSGPIGAEEAIGDLITSDRPLIPNVDSGLAGFKEVAYLPPKQATRYQSLLRKDALGRPNSMRLANHSVIVSERFRAIVSSCCPGRSLSDEDRKRLGMKKHATTVLAAKEPASTVTTLPDDIIHYSEPRILTVRENARLQSFPDWFSFTGKYTSGGPQRKHDCPRYSQVGNAVPPLFSEAVGTFLRELCEGNG